MWLQNGVIALIVLGCAIYMGSQFLGTFRGKRSKFGSCCAKGCPPPAKASERVVFLPVESLRKRTTG
jgi:hypothetical protein